MDQFLDPNSCGSKEDDSKDHNMDDEAGLIFPNSDEKEMAEPLKSNLLNNIEKRGSDQATQPLLQRGISFSKPDSGMGFFDSSMTNIFQGVNCKKNLFGSSDEENKDPNFDISMSSSPEKEFKTPVDGLLDGLSKDSKSK